MINHWYKGTVLQGNRIGRTIGFPTINLDPSIVPRDIQEGVYAALVKVDTIIYKGALYIGPRKVLDETHRVLEIYLLDFNREIYGEVITFALKDYIRAVKNFSNLQNLKHQLNKDIDTIEILSKD